MAEDNKVLTQIQARCSALGWTTYRLAKESGIPYSSLNNMIKRNTVPTIATLEKICVGFNISVSDFFNESADNNHCDTLSDGERILLERYRSLSDDKKSLLDTYIKELAAS